MCKSVLIVEDDALLSIVQQRIVEKMGHRVVASVKTGQVAIEKEREENPDIILMDISLDGEIDGIETMREIRKNSSVPVIYLSGNTKTEYPDDMIPPVDFLIKPVKQHQLKSCFEKAFVKTEMKQQAI